MSLYVGRLSPHVCPEQLIRNFRKFGNCDLRLKNGYGFVIYEVNEDAERALRALRGKSICGEPISLYWSNRQPRPFQRSTRPRRIYEPYHQGNIKEEGNGVHIRDSQDHRGFSRSAPHIPGSNGGRHRDDSHDKEKGYAYEVIKRKRDMTLTEGVIDEGNASESNPVESDRWGEPVNDALIADGVENGSEFDRYEPYHGYDSRDETENNQMANSYSSPDRGGSQGKGLLEQSNDEPDKNFDKLKPKPKCYNCGQIGHIKRKCPEGDARRENFSKFRLWREEINFRDRGDEKRKMIRTNSWGRQDTIRGPLVVRYHERDMKESHSGNARRLVRRSGCYTERRKNQPKLRAKTHAKKQSKQEHGIRKKLLKKRRARRLDTSSLSSDSSSTNSSSRSESSRSKPRASSRSTSRSSSRSLSPSSSSRSVSVSSYSKSKSSASKARSKSGSHISLSLSVSVDKSGCHISPSLSVSLDEKPPSSPHNVLLNVFPSTPPKGKVQHPTSPISNHLLLESSEPKDTFAALNVDNEINGQYLGHNADDARASSSMIGLKENCSFINLPKSVGISEGSNEQGALLRKPMMRISGCEGRHPVKIMTHEMILALKHYGLPAPEQIESGVSVEEYFGAARLWPWEMIYYRRLKKGPISTENYARRLEQNKEFGIIDKYIRSSSGWSECEHKN